MTTCSFLIYCNAFFIKHNINITARATTAFMPHKNTHAEDIIENNVARNSMLHAMEFFIRTHIRPRCQSIAATTYTAAIYTAATYTVATYIVASIVTASNVTASNVAVSNNAAFCANAVTTYIAATYIVANTTTTAIINLATVPASIGVASNVARSSNAVSNNAAFSIDTATSTFCADAVVPACNMNL